MSDDASRARIAAAGFDMHLVKPVEPKRFLGITDALFRLRRRGRVQPGR